MSVEQKEMPAEPVSIMSIVQTALRCALGGVGLTIIVIQVMADLDNRRRQEHREALIASESLACTTAEISIGKSWAMVGTATDEYCRCYAEGSAPLLSEVAATTRDSPNIPFEVQSILNQVKAKCSP
jgi:hypothetical protein